MDGERAACPDGFTMDFFKKCWDVVKNDLLVFDEFFERGVINNSMNSTFIALILKKEGLIGPKDYKPISLIGSVNKIITKVLSKRICEVMGDITLPTKDRQILDKVM